MGLVLTTTRDRKVRTAEELEAAIEEPMKVAPTRNVWIHEGLEDQARRLGGRPTESVGSYGKGTRVPTSNRCG